MALADNPFDLQIAKAGKLLIFRGGKQIMIVSEKKAEALIPRLGIDPHEDQQILARITGQ